MDGEAAHADNRAVTEGAALMNFRHAIIAAIMTVMALELPVTRRHGTSAAAEPVTPAYSHSLVAEILADARTNGDARRGAGVFNMAATGCTACPRQRCPSS